MTKKQLVERIMELEKEMKLTVVPDEFRDATIRKMNRRLKTNLQSRMARLEIKKKEEETISPPTELPEPEKGLHVEHVVYMFLPRPKPSRSFKDKYCLFDGDEFVSDHDTQIQADEALAALEKEPEQLVTSFSPLSPKQLDQLPYKAAKLGAMLLSALSFLWQ